MEHHQQLMLVRDLLDRLSDNAESWQAADEESSSNFYASNLRRDMAELRRVCEHIRAHRPHDPSLPGASCAGRRQGQGPSTVPPLNKSRTTAQFCLRPQKLVSRSEKFEPPNTTSRQGFRSWRLAVFNVGWLAPLHGSPSARGLVGSGNCRRQPG